MTSPERIVLSHSPKSKIENKVNLISNKSEEDGTIVTASADNALVDRIGSRDLTPWGIT